MKGFKHIDDHTNNLFDDNIVNGADCEITITVTDKGSDITEYTEQELLTKVVNDALELGVLLHGIPISDDEILNEPQNDDMSCIVIHRSDLQDIIIQEGLILEFGNTNIDKASIDKITGIPTPLIISSAEYSLNNAVILPKRVLQISGKAKVVKIGDDVAVSLNFSLGVKGYSWDGASNPNYESLLDVDNWVVTTGFIKKNKKIR